MQGRLENKLKTENKIMEMIEGCPDYLVNYAYNIMSSREPRTCKEYIRKVKQFLTFLNKDYSQIDIASVTDSDISRYIMSIETKKVKKRDSDGRIKTEIVPASASHIKGTHTTLMGFFSYLQMKGYIRDNPVKLVGRIKREDVIERRKLTEEDLKKILKAVNDLNETEDFYKTRDIAILMLFMNTGMRETALTEINLSDINFSKNTLRIIDKRHTEHKYFINEKLKRALMKYIGKRNQFLRLRGEESDALFVTQKSGRISSSTVNELVKKYTYEALGQKLSPHKLRAAYCTILYDKTHDIEFVREAVGHRSVSVTQRYIAKDGQDKIKASNMMADLLE